MKKSARINHMQVKVKLFASLKDGRFETGCVKLPEGSTVQAVLEIAGIPQDDVSIIFVNNLHAGFDRRLMEGDTVCFFPPIGGG